MKHEISRRDLMRALGVTGLGAGMGAWPAGQQAAADTMGRGLPRP